MDGAWRESKEAESETKTIQQMFSLLMHHENNHLTNCLLDFFALRVVFN